MKSSNLFANRPNFTLLIRLKDGTKASTVPVSFIFPETMCKTSKIPAHFESRIERERMWNRAQLSGVYDLKMGI